MKQTSDLRRIFENTFWSAPIRLVPDSNWPEWETAKVGLGPFPARVRLVESSRMAQVEAVLTGYDIFDVEWIWQSVGWDLPRPGMLQLTDSEDLFVWFKLSYDRATVDEAVGVLCAAALLVEELTKRLWTKLDAGVQRRLQGFGFQPDGTFNGDVRRLLSREPLEFQSWEQLN